MKTSRLRQWTKFREILGRCRRCFAVSNAVSRLSLSCSLPEILAFKVAIELQSRRKSVVFGPQFLGVITQKSLRSVLLPTNTCRVLKFRKDPLRGVDCVDS